MKKLSPSRQSLIIKVLELLVHDNEDSDRSIGADSNTTDGREYLFDDNENQILYELKKLLNREV